MRSKVYYFLGLLSVICFLTMDYFLNQKMMSLKTYSTQKKTVVLNTLPLPNPIQKSVISVPGNLQFETDFKNEVAQIDQIENDPEVIENRLQSLARQMELSDRLYLKSILNNHKSTDGDRAMAIELLARNQTAESAEILKNFTTAEYQNEHELIFKAQAIEGLAGFQDQNTALNYLNEISQKSKNQFLKDHAQKAENSLKNLIQ